MNKNRITPVTIMLTCIVVASIFVCAGCSRDTPVTDVERQGMIEEEYNDPQNDANAGRDEEITIEQQIVQRLHDIVIDEINFRDATMEGIMEFLAEASRAYDDQNLPPEQRGVNITMLVSPGAFIAAQERKVTLSARDISIFNVLNFVCELSHFTYSVYGELVVLQPMFSNPNEGTAADSSPDEEKNTESLYDFLF